MAETALSQSDRQAAVQEFQEHHALRPNAEELISANSAGFSSALRAAQYESIDAEATDELDLEEIGGMTTVSGQTVSDVGKPVGASVRGNAIVVLVIQPDGRSTKLVVPANDDYEAPVETPAEAAQQAIALSNVELTKQVQELRDEMAAELAELRAEREAATGEAVTAAQEEMAEKAAAAAEEAEAAEAERQEQAGTSASQRAAAQQAAAEKSGEPGEAGEVTYPRSHDGLDDLLDESDADEPTGWEDMKVDEKIAYLKQQGVKPE